MQYGYPEDAMSARKLSLLHRTGNVYAKKYNLPMEMCRFDFVGILALPNQDIEYRYIPDIC